MVRRRNRVNRPNRAGARLRGESAEMMLTGGTRDVKPETLSFSAAQSAADTTTTTTVALPVLRNFSSGNGSRAQIVEVLKVFFELPSLPEVDCTISATLSTKNFGTTAVAYSDGNVFAKVSQQEMITTSGQALNDKIHVLDLTDGAGNGILIATDNIFCQVLSSATSSANTVACKVLYRVYAASVTEYVGIVQGQQ